MSLRCASSLEAIQRYVRQTEEYEQSYEKEKHAARRQLDQVPMIEQRTIQLQEYLSRQAKILGSKQTLKKLKAIQNQQISTSLSIDKAQQSLNSLNSKISQAEAIVQRESHVRGGMIMHASLIREIMKEIRRKEHALSVSTTLLSVKSEYNSKLKAQMEEIGNDQLVLVNHEELIQRTLEKTRNAMTEKVSHNLNMQVDRSRVLNEILNLQAAAKKEQIAFEREWRSMQALTNWRELGKEKEQQPLGVINLDQLEREIRRTRHHEKQKNGRVQFSIVAAQEKLLHMRSDSDILKERLKFSDLDEIAESLSKSEKRNIACYQELSELTVKKHKLMMQVRDLCDQLHSGENFDVIPTLAFIEKQHVKLQKIESNLTNQKQILQQVLQGVQEIAEQVGVSMQHHLLVGESVSESNIFACLSKIEERIRLTLGITPVNKCTIQEKEKKRFLAPELNFKVFTDLRAKLAETMSKKNTVQSRAVLGVTIQDGGEFRPSFASIGTIMLDPRPGDHKTEFVPPSCSDEECTDDLEDSLSVEFAYPSI